jgi:predicted MFS family arabinose efflux permease
MEAPTPAERTVRRRTVAAVVLACVVGQSFARFSFGLLLPAVKADLDVSYGLAGWLGTINLGNYLIGTVLVSIASLRLPPHRLVQIGVATAATGIGVLALAPSTPLLLLGMVLCGLGGACSWVPAPIVAISAFPPERRALATGVCSAGIGVGISLAVVLSMATRAVADDAGLWRPIWLIEAGIGFAVALWSLRVLQPVPVAPGKPPRISVLRQVPAWWAPTAAYTCFGLGYVLYALFIVAALEQDSGFGTNHAGIVFAAFGLGSATGALTVGRLADRIGARAAFVASFMLAAVPPLTVPIGTEPIVSITAFMFGMAMSGAVASIIGYLQEHVRPQEFPAAFGAVTVAFGVAQTIGPRLGGWMADRSGDFDHVFWLSSACWVAGGVFALGVGSQRSAPGSRAAHAPMRDTGRATARR